ncbi:Os12g0251933 [Oryza sativa Japonica Group]|uniref:Os12g0251933 protein n=1 Tax=Oryza sativa subsp. japonica TaxID=39947 RepID=A0A0P0Y8N0_ORYSJ|nr:Os12g0251933 [Oryza sativa Japonica Group]
MKQGSNSGWGCQSRHRDGERGKCSSDSFQLSAKMRLEHSAGVRERVGSTGPTRKIALGASACYLRIAPWISLEMFDASWGFFGDREVTG